MVSMVNIMPAYHQHGNPSYEHISVLTLALRSRQSIASMAEDSYLCVVSYKRSITRVRKQHSVYCIVLFMGKVLEVLILVTIFCLVFEPLVKELQPLNIIQLCYEAVYLHLHHYTNMSVTHKEVLHYNRRLF